MIYNKDNILIIYKILNLLTIIEQKHHSQLKTPSEIYKRRRL